MSEDIDSILEGFRKAGDNPNLPTPSKWNTEYSLRPYQRVGASHLAVKRSFVLGDPTGSGKTPQELYAWALIHDQRIKEGSPPENLWVVTTKSTVLQWASEIEKFITDPKLIVVGDEKNHSKKNPGSKQEKRVNKFVKFVNEPGSIIVQSWDNFRNDWLDIRESLEESDLSNVQLTLDEAQRLKSPTSTTTAVANAVIPLVDRVHGLTATLVHNKAYDAWNVMKVICDHHLSETLFRKLYCIIEKQQLGWGKNKKYIFPIVGYKDLDKYKNELKGDYLGRDDSELEGERPGTVHITKKFQLSTKQKNFYLDIESGILNTSVKEVENDDGSKREKEVVHYAAALAKAQLAVNSPEVFQDDTEVKELTRYCKANKKLEVLKDLMEDEIEERPVILYSRLRSTIDTYEKAFKKRNPVRITGSEGEKQRFQAAESFMSGKTNMIFLTDAGGVGLNLQRASDIIMIDRPWSPGGYVQLIGRARRIGSEVDFIRIYHLTAEDTIDEFIDAMISDKFGQVDQITQGRDGLVPQSEVLPSDIANYARRVRIGKSK
jgi:SNF2 family DNA or RNA helicase